MQTESKHIAELLLKKLQKGLSVPETSELEGWLKRSVRHQHFAQELEDGEVLMELIGDKDETTEQLILHQVKARITEQDGFKQATGSGSPVHRVHLLQKVWFRYAAILLMIVGTATFIYLNNQPQKEIAVLRKPTDTPADIQPGGNKAILTLADGSTILLDSAANGSLAKQGNTRIVKIDAGNLAYRSSHGDNQVNYNTLSTPIGGQYQLTLPDGSKAWLNAASSIRFPAAFGKDRIVEITGELYFEVTPDKNKPFFVKTGATTIEVLGTSFNVNGYLDEPAVKTSLLEGSIKIEQTILKPGEAFEGGKRIRTNLQQDLAWKNGIFDFGNRSLEQSLRQVSKWYNVAIVYKQGIPNIQFGGKIKRNLNFSELLHFLEGMGLRYELTNERQLIILP